MRRLSPRQKQALQLVLLGLRSKEIATAMGITPRTVDGYIVAACAAVGEVGRLKGAIKAQSLGMLE